MGGQWDEWYATFSNGWLGWLAEAQGRFYITFQYPIPEGVQLPSFDQLELGQQVPGLPWPTPLMVAETGRATALGAKGEIPYLLTPGETYYYADLSGANGAFGTLDYNQTPPLIFLGQQVTLADLGITTTRAPEREERRVGAAQISCPNCGGPLELRAPDKTERVTCPNCNSLLDVNQGQLQFLKALEKPWFQPLIPLGTTGEVPEGKMTVIGAMARSVTVEGTQYFWSEYLLYQPQIGFRWLVHSDDHWNYVRAVPPGEVYEIARSATYQGKSYQDFSGCAGRVSKSCLVSFTGRSKAVSRCAASIMLSRLTCSRKKFRPFTLPIPTKRTKQNELQARSTGRSERTCRSSRSRRAFSVSGLPRPSNIAPNQPYKHWWVYKYWLRVIVVLLLALAGFLSIRRLRDRRSKCFRKR